MHASHQNLNFQGKDKFWVYYSIDSLYPPHWHEALELVFALDGDIEIGIENSKILLHRGDIALINCHEIHSFLQQVTPLKRLILQIDPAYSQNFSDIMRHKRFKENLIPKKSQERSESSLNRQLSEKFEKLIWEKESEEPGSSLAIEAIISNILVLLIRNMPTKDSSPGGIKKAGLRKDRLNRVFSYIEENYTRAITLTEIAEISHFSTYHFTRFFRENTGITFNHYLNRLRISKSLIYLTETNDKIIDIAYNTGFGSTKTFNRVFKSLNGCSPSHFRKQQTQMSRE